LQTPFLQAISHSNDLPHVQTSAISKVGDKLGGELERVSLSQGNLPKKFIASEDSTVKKHVAGPGKSWSDAEKQQVWACVAEIFEGNRKLSMYKIKRIVSETMVQKVSGFYCPSFK
jgi:hypothetical protein